MEFTELEKKMIVGGLESEWGDNKNAVEAIVKLHQSGIRFEGQALEEAFQVFKEIEMLFCIEKKIFESLDDGEEKQILLKEIDHSISQFNECKEIVGFFKNDG